MTNFPKNKQLIIFDGVCNLCNSKVLFIIKHDKKNRFMFAPIQSESGQQIISQFNIDTAETDSILLYSHKNGLKIKSTAALQIAKLLRFPVSLWSIFLIVPACMRNWVYDLIANNRYKWFGRNDKCMVPTSELKSKFLN